MNTGKSSRSTGSLKISQDVIVSIARVSALETDGVAGIASHPGNVGKLFSRSLGKKPVCVGLTDDSAEIDIGLDLKFGASIPDVCAAVQKNVRENVQTMTGIVVSKVNVTVAGISFAGEVGDE